MRTILSPRLLAPALLLLAAWSAAAGAQGADTVAFSLESAVERALRYSDEVRTAAANVEVADAQVLTARAGGLPQLRLSGTYTHQIENARAQAVGQIFNQPNTYNVNANVSQTLFQGGRVFAATRAAGRVRRAARLSAAETRALTTLDVQRAYLQALFSTRLVEIQEQNLTLASARVT